MEINRKKLYFGLRTILLTISLNVKNEIFGQMKSCNRKFAWNLSEQKSNTKHVFLHF